MEPIISDRTAPVFGGTTTPRKIQVCCYLHFVRQFELLRDAFAFAKMGVSSQYLQGNQQRAAFSVPFQHSAENQQAF